MRPFLLISLILGVLLLSSVECLDHYDEFREGSCSKIWAKPKSQPSRYQNIDIDWVDTLTYNSAGSKYHMYKMASAHPRYDSMNEDEFYYDFCYKRNTTSTSHAAIGTGFGRVLETWDVRTRDDLPGVYIQAFPRNNLPRSDSLLQRITLTDNKSFAFLLDCWEGSNQRAWNVISNPPTLSPQARRMIEEHAAVLGFSRRDYVFLRYESCEADEVRREKERNLARRGSPVLWKQSSTTTTTRWPQLKRVAASTTSNYGKEEEEGSGWTKD